MDDCCNVPNSELDNVFCPKCKQKGKGVQIVTLKALLTPSALETIDPQSSFLFCSNPDCEVVYFSDTQKFTTDSVKVPVFQKDNKSDVPVCYCFGWTRERLLKAVEENKQPAKHISGHVQANRCGCDVNNPQGSCCLGNVTAYIHSLHKSNL